MNLSEALIRAGVRVWQAYKNQYDALFLALGVAVGGGVFWGFWDTGGWGENLYVLYALFFGIGGISLVFYTYLQWFRWVGLWLVGGAILGFASAFGWVWWGEKQVLPDWAVAEGRAVWVVGVLDTVASRKEEVGRRARIALELRPVVVVAGDGLEREVPAVRVTVAAKRAEGLVVGQGVAAEVQLFGPTGPKFKGDRDDRLDWRMGTVRVVKGFVRGRLEPSEVAAVGLVPQTGWAERARNRIAEGVRGMGNGVVAALLVGVSGQVPQPLYEAYRASGLLHLLVISGLQMTIVAGGLFWLVRRGLVWAPYIGEALALHVPVRMVAAVVALLGVSAYAALVGGEVSVLRAVLMTALGLGALLAGRGRDLLRAWALVFVALLLVWPEWLVKSGFQLSFAAVLGLILWGIARAGDGERKTGYGLLRKISMLVESTLVVSLFTAPVLAWHFGAVPLAGVVANVVAIPLMALATWLGMAALVAWPVGLQAPPLWAMTQVVNVVNEVAVQAAGWPGAVLRLEKAPEREEFCCGFGGVVKVDGVYYAFPDTAGWVLGQWARRWNVSVTKMISDQVTK